MSGAGGVMDAAAELAEEDDALEPDDGVVSPREVGHNIYILCHQLAKHSKELAVIFRSTAASHHPGTPGSGPGATVGIAAAAQPLALPSGGPIVGGGAQAELDEYLRSPKVVQALKHYASHTAQIEVCTRSVSIHTAFPVTRHAIQNGKSESRKTKSYRSRIPPQSI